MRLGWGHDDGAFFFSRPDAAQQECCEPGFTLLCMGLFSRFFVQALPCTAEGTVCRVRDTRSLVPRAYGTNRSSSNTSCSSGASTMCPCTSGNDRLRVQLNTPTIAPIRQVVSVPDTIDFNPSELISSRRCGAMVPRPPIMMPRLPKLAKPHIA